jgi:hypothetical protein
MALDFQSGDVKIIDCYKKKEDVVTLTSEYISNRTSKATRGVGITRQTVYIGESDIVEYVDNVREREEGRAVPGKPSTVAEGTDRGSAYENARMLVTLDNLVRDQIELESNALVGAQPGLTIVSFPSPYNDSYVIDSVRYSVQNDVVTVTASINSDEIDFTETLKETLGIKENSA